MKKTKRAQVNAQLWEIAGEAMREILQLADLLQRHIDDMSENSAADYASRPLLQRINALTGVVLSAAGEGDEATVEEMQKTLYCL